MDNDLILISYLDCQSTGVYFYSLSHHKVLLELCTVSQANKWSTYCIVFEGIGDM